MKCSMTGENKNGNIRQVTS